MCVCSHLELRCNRNEPRGGKSNKSLMLIPESGFLFIWDCYLSRPNGISLLILGIPGGYFFILESKAFSVSLRAVVGTFDAKFTPMPARDAWRTGNVAVPHIPRLPHENRGGATHLARLVASAAPHAGRTGHRPLNCCAIATNSSTAGDVTGGSAIPNSK